MNFITRFAPSPTGELHIGHAYSAICGFEFARKNNGKFILRIEDTDFGRCKNEYANAIFEDLKWLGITWDDNIRFQSQHFDEYNKIIDKLNKMGVLYRCFKTRKEMEDAALSAPHGFRDGIDGIFQSEIPNDAETQLRLINNEPFAWRLSCKKAMEIIGNEPLFFEDELKGKILVNPYANGDIIIARKDSKASYHLCAVYDDELQGITNIIRGDDLLNATHIQIVLQKLLNYKTPKYHHHKLLLDENGKRFAKRDKAVTLKSMRESGIKPNEIWQKLGFR